MSGRAFASELAAACKLSTPDLQKIKTILVTLREQHELSASIVAHCLVTVLANRREHSSRHQFRAVLDTIQYLLETEPDCLKEIIQLNHATKTPQVKDQAEEGERRAGAHSNSTKARRATRDSEPNKHRNQLSNSSKTTKKRVKEKEHAPGAQQAQNHAPRLTRTVPNPQRIKSLKPNNMMTPLTMSGEFDPNYANKSGRELRMKSLRRGGVEVGNDETRKKESETNVTLRKRFDSSSWMHGQQSNMSMRSNKANGTGRPKKKRSKAKHASQNLNGLNLNTMRQSGRLNVTGAQGALSNPMIGFGNNSQQSNYASHVHIQGTLDRAQARHDRFCSVTSFEADYDPKLSLSIARKHRKVVYNKVQTLKSFCFTPVYTLFESISFKPKSDFRYENVKDLEQRLVELICLDHDKHADVNMLLSVKISSEKKTQDKKESELFNYQPVWHRLLNHGNFDILSIIMDRIDVDIRKTMFDVKASVQPKTVKVGLRERGLDIADPNAELEAYAEGVRFEKYIISSRTALHEICSWPIEKCKRFKGVGASDIVAFAEKLIKKGADVNAICMRREERSKVIRQLMRQYLGDTKFKIKHLPSENVAFYIWQTPLSMAIRSRNMGLVKLLASHGAKQEYGDIYYPRKEGIKFDVESFDIDKLKENKSEIIEEQLGFKLAADLETVPTVYSLKDVYYKVLEFDNNFSDWKFVISNEQLFNRSFKPKKASSTS